MSHEKPTGDSISIAKPQKREKETFLGHCAHSGDSAGDLIRGLNLKMLNIHLIQN